MTHCSNYFIYNLNKESYNVKDPFKGLLVVGYCRRRVDDRALLDANSINDCYHTRYTHFLTQPRKNPTPNYPNYVLRS